MKNLLQKISGAGNTKGSNSKDSMDSLRNWYSDRYENAVVQRNILFVTLIVAVVTISLCVLLIRYVKSSLSIEPFVIEIEKKTGVPTVVDPVSSKVYSADKAILRYFVMQYVRAREEYISVLYDYNFEKSRLLSTDEVFNTDYRRKFGRGNPNSPVNLYQDKVYRKVVLKSIIFPTDQAAQVRVSLVVEGIQTSTEDKIIYLEFQFSNLQLSDQDRLINPLGFQVTNYRIEDERGVGTK